MKQLGEHKWVVIVAAVAILLSVGAIAWSAVAWTEAKDDPDLSKIRARLSQMEATGRLAGVVAPSAGLSGEGKGRRQVVQGLKEAGAEHLMVLLEQARDEMTTEDQEQYDALVQAVKDQRGSLQEATQELAGTLKELRALVAKYVGPNDGGAE